MADEIPPSRYTSIAPFIVDVSKKFFHDNEDIIRGFIEHLLDQGLNPSDFAPGPSQYTYIFVDGERRLATMYPVLNSEFPLCPMCEGIGRLDPNRKI